MDQDFGFDSCDSDLDSGCNSVLDLDSDFFDFDINCDLGCGCDFDFGHDFFAFDQDCNFDFGLDYGSFDFDFDFDQDCNFDFGLDYGSFDFDFDLNCGYGSDCDYYDFGYASRGCGFDIPFYNKKAARFLSGQFAANFRKPGFLFAASPKICVLDHRARLVAGSFRWIRRCCCCYRPPAPIRRPERLRIKRNYRQLKRLGNVRIFFHQPQAIASCAWRGTFEIDQRATSD